MKTISMTLAPDSIDKAIKELQDYSKDLKEKAHAISERLASIGATNVSVTYAQAFYDGIRDVDISVEETDKGYKILASGETVLFLEFGAGVKYGSGHPLNGEFGMGPGTYNPTSENWKSPYGWWFGGKYGAEHTYGNPPSMAMYNTGKDLKKEILRVAQEVFSS